MLFVERLQPPFRVHALVAELNAIGAGRIAAIEHHHFRPARAILEHDPQRKQVYVLRLGRRRGEQECEEQRER